MHKPNKKEVSVKRKKGPPTMSSTLNGASDINHDTFSNKYRPSVLVASLNRTSQFLQFSSS